MENLTTPSMSETLLNTAKIDMSNACEQNMDLVSKMEMVDNPSDVNMENSNSQHLLETQYINIQRVSDLTKNLAADSIPPELLSHHVVDLGANPEYSQHVVTNAQFYGNSDFLSTNFSEEDRRLNAALIAVKFIQQNITTSSTNPSLNADMLHDKQTLPSVSSISTDKVISSIVPNYVQAVESRNQPDLNIHISNHSSEQHLNKEADQHSDQIMKLYQPLMQSENKTPTLPPLKKISQSLSSRSAKYIATDDHTHTTNADTLITNSNLDTMQRSSLQMSESMTEVVKSECDVSSDLNASSDNNEMGVTDDYDSEADDARSSQKSLPHKKRIPNKLKRALTATPTRNIHAKCYKCTKCGEQFPNQSTFNAHKVQQHSSKKTNFSCELCNKTCLNQLKFFEHLKSHYEPSLNTENFNRASSEKGDREPDINTNDQNKIDEVPMNDGSDRSAIFNSGESNLTCGKCGRVFRRQKAFDCHMSLSHPKQEDIEEFSEPEDMMEGIRHVVNMVPAGDEEDKNFEPWQSAKIENGVIHQTLQTSQPTSIKSDTSQLIAVEVKSEEGDDFEDERSATKSRKQLSCPHCERTFIHRNSLLYHIRSHTGHRPHQCELCGKSFFAAGALKIHMRLHSGDKPYKCEFCERFFRQWGDLKYHVTSIHSNTKMFQCEYCGKDFARKYSLVVHRRIHTGEKNYICEYCTKTFRAASYLQNHRRIHTGEKPHMCEVCGKPFRVRSDMKRHMKTHGDVSVVNVLTDLSNSTSDNNSQDVRNNMACLVDNQEINVIDKHEEASSHTISDPESDPISKPVVTTVSESVTPLNLNVKPAQTAEDGLYNYSREEDLVDRENTGTLYVWIQTNQDTILPDS